MTIRLVLEDGDAYEIDDPDAEVDPTELAGIFSSTAEWAVEELGAQQVRDLLEAVIELGGKERN
jgi:hypothetical protein